MSASRHRLPYIAAAFSSPHFHFGPSLAATGATKDEAVAMVKKAVAFIQTEGPANAYPAITNPSGRFVDRDLYIVVYGLDGWCWPTAPTPNESAPTRLPTRIPTARRS